MQEDTNQKYVIVATLAFIVGFGLSWLIMANKANAPEVDSEDTQTEVEGTETTGADNESSSTTSPTSSSVRVSDQSAGTSVAVESVTFAAPGWVVIHEDNAGAPGKILGAQLFDIGVNSGTVELLRGTVAGGTYYAMLHNDNGDRAFDPKKDVPLTAEGAPVMTAFVAK